MNKGLMAMVLFLSLTDCASMNPANTGPSSATASHKKTPVAPAKTAHPQELTAAEIKDFGSRIQALTGAIYSVVHNSYSLYLGGQFTATFQANDGQLILTDDTGTTSCVFSTQGKLSTSSNAAPCQQWLVQLNSALNPPAP